MGRLQICTVSKRALALVLVLSALLAFWGCSGDEKEVTWVQGENARGGYRFDYPEGWTLVKEGADTRVSADLMGGSVPTAYVRFTAFDNSGWQSAEDYWDDKGEMLASVYEEATVEKRSGFDFEGGSGYEVYIKATIKGSTNLDGQPDNNDGSADYRVRQLVFEKGGRVCVATYMATASNDGDKAFVVDGIKNSFEFIDIKADSTEVKDCADFTVPVPEGWTLDEAQAYYKLSKGKATITAAVYSAGDNSTALDCWNNLYDKELEASFEEYKVLSVNEKASLAGRVAVDAEYTAKTATGGSYHFRQTTAVYAGEVYVIILTASDADYEGAVAGYEAVIEGFKLK